jgi:hypothetical protein
MDKETIANIDLLINVAADEGIQSALEKHGEVVNGREAIALTKLSADELQTMAKLNAKLSGLSKSGLSDLNVMWTCGIVC